MTGDQAARPLGPAAAGAGLGPVGRSLHGLRSGLYRFRTALRSVLTIALILEAEWVFVHFSNALQIQAARSSGDGSPRLVVAHKAVAQRRYRAVRWSR
jgi:hypothetical protein